MRRVMEDLTNACATNDFAFVLKVLQDSAAVTKSTMRAVRNTAVEASLGCSSSLKFRLRPSRCSARLFPEGLDG